MKKRTESGDPPSEGEASTSHQESINPFGDMAEVWKNAMAPWNSWIQAAEPTGRTRATMLGEAAAKAWMHPEKPLENLGSLSDGLRELVGLPQFADLPDLPAEGLPSFKPAMELIAIAQEYVRVGIPIWVEACKRFEEEAALRKGKEESSDSAGEALELWNSVLDRTLMKFNRSSEFAELQRRYLRAGTRQRLETRRYFEMLAKLADGPTRAEMDDVYRRLHELRREVTALQAAAAAPTSQRKAPERAANRMAPAHKTSLRVRSERR